MTYTQAQIDKANAVDLEKFLRAQGETLVRSGKEYRWKAHDSLTVCGNKWFRHSQSKGGLPVDFVMEFYGKSFPEAVQLLTGEPGEAQPEADPAPSPAFRLPLRNVTNANILNYLTQERKLSPSLVNFFIAAGDIYEDAAHHNVVFVGRDADGHPRYASCRGIYEKFRQDVAGAEKSFGFAHRGTDKQLMVFEAPIDLLSFIELFPKNWQQHNYLSLGGVSAKALQQFLSERPDMERVFLCLDADKAGEDACKRLAALLPDTVSVTRIQPTRKDWNEVLVHRAEIPNRDYFKSTVLKEPPKKDSVKIIRMSDVELTPVDWLWKPYQGGNAMRLKDNTNPFIHVNPPYQLMVIHSSKLVYPRELYQRGVERKRVELIAAHFNEYVANEPKVSFRNGQFIVTDGQHTIEGRILRNGGKDLPILCKVYTGMTVEQEALLFAEQNGFSAPLTAGIKLRAKVVGGDAISKAFLAATNRVGLSLNYDSQQLTDYRIGCVGTAFRLYKQMGEPLYCETMRLIVAAWEGKPDSFRASVLKGMMHFVELYHGEFSEERLLRALRNIHPVDIYRIGQDDPAKLRGWKKYVFPIYTAYNGKCRKDALPMKF